MNKELMLMLNSPEESTEKLTPSKLKLPTLVELSSNSNSLVLLITPTLYLLLNPWLMTKPSLMTDPLPVLLKTTNMPPITPEFQAKLLLPVTLSISWITRENSSKDSELDLDDQRI
jgi:hypothetical protein